MTKEQLENKWPEIEKNLIVGDILLFHNRGHFLSRLIRARSKSYWSHSALIFKDRRIVRFGSPLIIEAFSQGIEIHKLQKYTDRFGKIDIGVKRFPNLSLEERTEFARSFMLNNIDVPYDYSRLVAYFLTGPLGKISSKFIRSLQEKTIRSDAFVCSTFIHKAFHAYSIHSKISRKQFSPEEIKLIEEESITPGDIAKDKNFEWIFNKRH